VISQKHGMNYKQAHSKGSSLNVLKKLSFLNVLLFPYAREQLLTTACELPKMTNMESIQWGARVGRARKEEI
jgi:hypothetical protein